MADFDTNRRFIIMEIKEIIDDHRRQFTDQQISQMQETAQMLNRKVVTQARCPKCGAARIGHDGECPRGCA